VQHSESGRGELAELLADLGGRVLESKLVQRLSDMWQCVSSWERLIGKANGNSQDRLLTIPQVAARLGVPAGYAYELARRGEIPTVRFGKYVRVRSADLQSWIDRHRADRAGR
jgi:excisionase family DNA binding protein